MNITKEKFLKRIDATMVEPDITDDQLADLIHELLPDKNYLSKITVNLTQISTAVDLLEAHQVGVASEIAYPLGNLPTEVKLIQLEHAIENGADQVDIVMQIDAIKVGEFDQVHKEVDILTERARGVIGINFIPNLAFLSEEQKIAAVKIVYEAGAGVKTSSGVNISSTIEDVKLLKREFVNLELNVCGGCDSLEQAATFLDVGANKITPSAPLTFLRGLVTLMRWQTQKV